MFYRFNFIVFVIYGFRILGSEFKIGSVGLQFRHYMPVRCRATYNMHRSLPNRSAYLPKQNQLLASSPIIVNRHLNKESPAVVFESSELAFSRCAPFNVNCILFFRNQKWLKWRSHTVVSVAQLKLNNYNELGRPSIRFACEEMSRRAEKG